MAPYVSVVVPRTYVAGSDLVKVIMPIEPVIMRTLDGSLRNRDGETWTAYRVHELIAKYLPNNQNPRVSDDGLIWDYRTESDVSIVSDLIRNLNMDSGRLNTYAHTP